MIFSTNIERAIVALAKVAELWETRLSRSWLPPSDSGFPWNQVRESLAALLPGMRTAREWVEQASVSIASPTGKSRTVTLILAGNTPLLAWSPLCACLLAGVETIRVKLSRDETVWTRLFVASLKEVAPELATTIELYDFPGEDERTYALLQNTNAVIAYGSDQAIVALQAKTPAGAPFFGYGHAVSVGLALGSSPDKMTIDSLAFNQDFLAFDQQGCLSPHILYVLQERNNPRTKDLAHDVCESLSHRLSSACVSESSWLSGKEVTAAMAGKIREARDLALFSGFTVAGDDALHWTLIHSSEPIAYPVPVGHRVLYISPVESAEQLRDLLAPVRGIVSSVGIAGELSPEWKVVLQEAGVSRLCKPGKMQTPPLDWQNGNRNLLAELLQLPGRET